LGRYLDPLRAENQALPTQKGVEWPPLRINESINFTSLRYTQCSTIKSHTCSIFLILYRQTHTYLRPRKDGNNYRKGICQIRQSKRLGRLELKVPTKGKEFTPVGVHRPYDRRS